MSGSPRTHNRNSARSFAPWPRDGDLRRLLSQGFYALLLVFMQQQATLHWLSHAIDATHAKPGHALPAEPCEQCAGLAALGAAAPSSPFVLPHIEVRHALGTPSPERATTQQLRLGYRSRAPPIPV